MSKKDSLKMETVSLDKITPNPRNPRVHPESEMNKLVKSIEKFGFRNPMILSKDKMIITGHARYEAAKRLELKEVPAIVWDVDEQTAEMYMVTDNRIQLDSTWDYDLLEELVREMADNELDLDSLGFDDRELTRLIEDVEEIVEEIETHDDENRIEDMDDDEVREMFGGSIFSQTPQGGGDMLLAGDAGDSVHDLVNLKIEVTSQELSNIRQAIDVYLDGFDEEERQSNPNFQRKGFILSEICKKSMEGF